MRKLNNFLKRIRNDEDGAALVEYAVLLGIILAVGVAIFTAIGTQTSGIFASLSTMLTSAK